MLNDDNDNDNDGDEYCDDDDINDDVYDDSFVTMPISQSCIDRKSACSPPTITCNCPQPGGPLAAVDWLRLVGR